jgi:hypothetical protein
MRRLLIGAAVVLLLCAAMALTSGYPVVAVVLVGLGIAVATAAERQVRR